MVVLEILWYIALAIFIALLFIVGSVVTQYLALFCWRRCTHCGHVMEYKGKKENGSNGYYLFHCTKCGKWEQIPCDDLIDNS